MMSVGWGEGARGSDGSWARPGKEGLGIRDWGPGSQGRGGVGEVGGDLERDGSLPCHLADQMHCPQVSNCFTPDPLVQAAVQRN